MAISDFWPETDTTVSAWKNDKNTTVDIGNSGCAESNRSVRIFTGSRQVTGIPVSVDAQQKGQEHGKMRSDRRSHIFTHNSKCSECEAVAYWPSVSMFAYNNILPLIPHDEPKHYQDSEDTKFGTHADHEKPGPGCYFAFQKVKCQTACIRVYVDRTLYLDNRQTGPPMLLSSKCKKVCYCMASRVYIIFTWFRNFLYFLVQTPYSFYRYIRIILHSDMQLW